MLGLRPELTVVILLVCYGWRTWLDSYFNLCPGSNFIPVPFNDIFPSNVPTSGSESFTVDIDQDMGTSQSGTSAKAVDLDEPKKTGNEPTGKYQLSLGRSCAHPLRENIRQRNSSRSGKYSLTALTLRRCPPWLSMQIGLSSNVTLQVINHKWYVPPDHEMMERRSTKCWPTCHHHHPMTIGRSILLQINERLVNGMWSRLHWPGRANYCEDAFELWKRTLRSNCWTRYPSKPKCSPAPAWRHEAPIWTSLLATLWL